MNPYLEVLDQRAFDQFVALWGEDAGDVIREIVTMYLDAGPRTLQDLRHALEEGNLREVRRMAHSFKGNSATLGAHRLARICQQIEDAAREGNAEQAQMLLQEAEHEFSHVQQALQSILDMFGYRV